MNVLICGSRSLDISINEINKVINSLNIDPKEIVILSRGDEGPDTSAINWAKENGNKFLLFKPNLEKYGNIAELIRNKTIVNNCDVCIAFWDGKSKGTKFIIDYTKKHQQKDLIVLTL